MLIFYDMCVNYVGDCEGTIYPGEEKTCTCQNYIYSGFHEPIRTDGNTASADIIIIIIATIQQSHDASQLNILKDKSLIEQNNKNKLLFFF